MEYVKWASTISKAANLIFFRVTGQHIVPCAGHQLGTGWLRGRTMVGPVCCLSAHRQRHPKLCGHYGGRAGSPLQGFCDLDHA